MEHYCIMMVSILCIAPSVFFTCCDSQQLAPSAHNDFDTHAASDQDYQLNHPGVLPRKLKLRDDQLASVKVYNGGDQDLSTRNAKKDVFSAGKAQHKKEVRTRKHTPIRTWREWVEAEGSDTSQYFTMDYSHVRRRRPIHNKFLPVAP